MNKLPFVLSFLLLPAVACASDAEYNANKSAWDAVNLSPAYEAGLSGKDVRVAIVDNGFWATHQEFTDKMTLSSLSTIIRKITERPLLRLSVRRKTIWECKGWHTMRLYWLFRRRILKAKTIRLAGIVRR